MDILCEYQCKYLIISRSFLLRMKSVLDKYCREKSKHIYIQYFFFFFENRAI